MVGSVSWEDVARPGGKDVLVGDLNDEGGIVGWRTANPLPTLAVYTTVLLL